MLLLPVVELQLWKRNPKSPQHMVIGRLLVLHRRDFECPEAQISCSAHTVNSSSCPKSRTCINVGTMR